MENYKTVAKNILENGVRAENRTGVDTVSTFGETLRFDLSKGFPAPTTKEGYFKGAVVELLWMLSGDTNVKFLNDHGVKFWNQWAIENEEQCYLTRKVTFADVMDRIGEIDGVYGIASIRKIHDAWASKPGNDHDHIPSDRELTAYYLQHRGWTTEERVRTCNIGDLGPLYGKMWRAFPNGDGTTTDQIQKLINQLRSNPTSRRHVVSTWFPALLPDERYSPQENVAMGKMALAPCHWNFVVKTERMTDEERLARYFKDLKTKYINELIREEMKVKGGCIGLENQQKLVLKLCPKYRLNLHVSLRSNDWCPGTPVNVMFYALLTHLLAEQVNMEVGELWLTATDAHVYENQIDGLKEQLTREPYPLPTLSIKRLPATIFDYDVSDFELVNYQHHPKIKYEVAK